MKTFKVTTVERFGSEDTGIVTESVRGTFGIAASSTVEALQWIKRNLSEYGDGAVNFARAEVYELTSWSGVHWMDTVWRVRAS